MALARIKIATQVYETDALIIRLISCAPNFSLTLVAVSSHASSLASVRMTFRNLANQISV